MPDKYTLTSSLRHLGALATTTLLIATLLACSSTTEEPPSSQQVSATEAKTQSTKKQWPSDKDEWKSLPDGTTLERTARLAEDAGGEVHYIDHPGRGDRTVLVLPADFVDGRTPLIVSLHGYGADSAYHLAYVPLHERVNTDGFALLLPNGTPDGEGNRSWNPTDGTLTEKTGKASEDDVAYLTELVAEARKVRDFGPVYFFGYSNGGFMSYHMACRGLPGLRAVASLSGTSYVEDSTCDSAPPVSVLHIHGTEDSVILFDGDESEPGPKSNGQRTFYASAHDTVTRWSQRAGYNWPENPDPYATLDFDDYVPGPETQAYRLEPSCAKGINIELWISEGSTHAPAYGDTFTDALLTWLLSQECPPRSMSTKHHRPVIPAKTGIHGAVTVRQSREEKTGRLRLAMEIAICHRPIRLGWSAIDGRTTRHESYRVSQKVRKRVESIFGWMKTVGGFRRSRYVGLERTGLCGELVATAYNLVRMSRLIAEREVEAPVFG